MITALGDMCVDNAPLLSRSGRPVPNRVKHYVYPLALQGHVERWTSGRSRMKSMAWSRARKWLRPRVLEYRLTKSQT